MERMEGSGENNTFLLTAPNFPWGPSVSGELGHQTLETEETRIKTGLPHSVESLVTRNLRQCSGSRMLREVVFFLRERERGLVNNLGRLIASFFNLIAHLPLSPDFQPIRLFLQIYY